MLILESKAFVKNITGKDICDFMLNYDDKAETWWPEMHLKYKTITRKPNNIGNIIHFVEIVGKRKLDLKAVVTKIDPEEEMIWHIKKFITVPVWLKFKFVKKDNGLEVSHIIYAGFNGIGRILDPLLRLYLTKRFETDMAEHAKIEFDKLDELISAKK